MYDISTVTLIKFRSCAFLSLVLHICIENVLFEKGVMILCRGRGEYKTERVCTLLPMKDFFILVLWLAEFWRILIKPGEYIMDEKATSAPVGGKKASSPVSHRGHEGRKA